ncbi:MAG TPA: MmgE/PrpD family protein, partial [Burkholderiales bacterium]|nr:MmgE/PrpD family protein [Burkholderiales bacterium]
MITQELCERITGTRFETLGVECVKRVKQAIKDGVAVAVAGSAEQPVEILAAHVRSLGGKQQSTVWGSGYKTTPVQASYVNGAATHVLDFEPMWLPPTHAVSPVVPAAFALAEALGTGGRDILAAVAKGIEVQGRVQLAANQFKPEKLRFHPPGIAGVLGAAVTAAHMLGLDGEKLAHALGIAASRAGALLANIGSMTKSAHCGHAAASGV